MKTTLIFHLTAVRIGKIKKKTTNADVNVGNKKDLITVGVVMECKLLKLV